MRTLIALYFSIPYETASPPIFFMIKLCTIYPWSDVQPQQIGKSRVRPQRCSTNALAFSHILGTYSPMTIYIACMMPCNLALLHTSKDPTLDNKELGSIGELHQISTLRHSSNLLVHSCFIAYLLHDKIVHN
jgi:hypothetical protein